MAQIKATTSTVLKKSTAQASTLNPEELSPVEQGKTFPVSDYQPADEGHYLVTLKFDAGEWYIFTGHWDCSWVDNSETFDGEVTEKHKEDLEADDPPTLQEIDWHDPDCRVSQYFRVFEVTQNDPRRIPQDPTYQSNIVELAKELDQVRAQWGGPVAVTSWYRPPEVNQEVGGAPNSQHLYGCAADVQPVNGEINSFQSWLDNEIWQNRALGYGAPLGFVHLDLRSRDLRWYY